MDMQRRRMLRFELQQKIDHLLEDVADRPDRLDTARSHLAVALNEALIEEEIHAGDDDATQ